MELSILVKEFAESSGLSGGFSRRDGSFSFVFDQRYRVRLVPDGHSAVMIGRVGQLPDAVDQRDAAIGRLLALALGRLRDGGETLALDEDEQTLLLQGHLPPDTDRPAFEQAVERFVNALATWQKSVAALSAAPPARPAMPFMPMFR